MRLNDAASSAAAAPLVPAFLRDGGTMGALIRAHDWSATALGPVDGWPASLRAVVRLMLTTNHPAFLFWGAEHLCLYNDAYSRSLGAEKHPHILGRSGRESWPEIWHIIGPQIEQVLSGGGATWHENQLVPMDRHGRREDVYWTYSYSPVDEAGAPDGIGGVLVLCTETTAQVRVAQRMQAAEARWRQLFEQAPGFMCLLRGPNFVFEFANPAYRRLVGRDDLIGLALDEALPWARAQGFAALLDEVYRTGRPYSALGAGLDVPGDHGIRTLYVDFVYAPVRAEDGAITGIFVLGSDVTERAEAARQLAESEERLRLAREASGVGIHDYDIANGRIRWDHAVRSFWGIGPDDPVTLEVFERGVHPDDLPAVRSAVAAATDPAGDGTYAAEYRVIHAVTGATTWVQATGRVRFDGGSAVRMVGTVRDVTAMREAEQRLRASEAFARHLADTAPDILYVYDIVRRANIWGNRQMTELLGYERAQIDAMSGRLIAELLHPDDAPRYLEHARRQLQLRDDEATEFEYRMKRVDGSWCWLVSREMVFQRDAAGVPVQLVGAAMDITARKAAEHALVESEARRTIALRAGNLAAWDFDVASGRNNWDGRLAEMLRVLPEAAADAAARWFDCIHPADRDRVRAEFDRALADEAPYDTEFRVHATDGSERWFASKAEAVRDEAGRIERLVGVVQDITERKLAELERERSRALLDTVLAAMPAAVIIADAGGRIVRWNRANEALWGLEGVDPAGFRGVEDFGQWKGWWYPGGAAVAPHDWGMARALRGEAVHGDVVEIERFSDGARRVMINMGAPVLAADGTLLGAVVVQTDITDRVAAEQALHHADRQKDVFLATLSHELRNPLAPIRTAADLLTDPALDAPRRAWAQGVIQRQVGHMARLLDDLLDIARVTRGKLELRRERVDLAAVVDSAVEAARPLIDRRNHRLRVVLPPDITHVDADPVRLAQILANLLTNAARYTDPGGAIELRATARGDEIEFAVTDDGIGIAPDSLPQLFQMFSQAADGGRAEGGLGIGLALVKGLVELHGGGVSVASPGLGRGSTFTVRLPIGVAASSPAAPSEETAARGPGRRVLVVDDNHDAADALGLSLALAGHDVRIAYDGRAALQLARAQRPEVAIVDLGMPVMDGLDLARRLRGETWSAGLRLVALTGWGQEEDRQRARAAGFDEHLTKPADPRTLLAALASTGTLPSP